MFTPFSSARKIHERVENSPLRLTPIRLLNVDYSTLKERYNVANRFGANAKGGFKFHYGLNAPFIRENMTGSGAVITKDGNKICGPGLEMDSTGSCVAADVDIACEPGWTKEGGVCVKSALEVQDGQTDAPSEAGGLRKYFK